MDIKRIKLGLSKIRKVHQSGVFMATTRKDDCNKLEAETKKVLGDICEVFQPKPILPQLIVTNLSKEYKEDDLIEELRSTNPNFSDDDKIRIVHTQQNKKDGKWSVFLQASPATFNKLVDRYIILDFSDHYVKEYVHTRRCLKCQQYGHKAVDCCSPPVCSRCASQHKT